MSGVRTELLACCCPCAAAGAAAAVAAAAAAALFSSAKKLAGIGGSGALYDEGKKACVRSTGLAGTDRPGVSRP